jgi:cytochrome c-type biogenesis protein CcmH/NrfF
VNGCGAPNAMRKKVAGMIEQGLTDKQIFEALLKEHGPNLVQAHLLP